MSLYLCQSSESLRRKLNRITSDAEPEIKKYNLKAQNVSSVTASFYGQPRSQAFARSGTGFNQMCLSEVPSGPSHGLHALGAPAVLRRALEADRTPRRGPLEKKAREGLRGLASWLQSRVFLLLTEAGGPDSRGFLFTITCTQNTSTGIGKNRWEFI